MGDSNTQPTDDTWSGTGQAAKLATKFVGIGSIGKLAAGNMYTGNYLRTEGTNGVLNFGKQFTQRPTRLKDISKYTSDEINKIERRDEISHRTTRYLPNLHSTRDWSEARSRYAQNQVTANYSTKTTRILSLMPICTAGNP